MAIKKDVITKFGITVKDCYLRIENISTSKDEMSFNLRFYADNGKPFFDEKIIKCNYAIDGENPFKQAYEYLKTIDEFSEAKDC